LKKFDEEQLNVVDEAAALAEDVTSNYYKFSPSQWRRSRYDIKTLKDLEDNERSDRVFAQILRYIGQRRGSDLGSTRFDFYKICLQDHTILGALDRDTGLTLFPLTAYVVAHELVHIVRFSRFLQSFEAYPLQRLEEESRVHTITMEMLARARVRGMKAIAMAYQELLEQGLPLDDVAEGSTVRDRQ
jgi:hypothetical protein